LTTPGPSTIVRALNLPNALTLLRIFLVPLLVVVLLTRAEGHVYVGAGIFGLAVLTDYLDGYFARRRNEVTRLGILLDPLADKLLIAGALLSLVEMGLVPAWVVMIILARELAVTGLRNVAAGRGVLIRASGLGKAKMVAQVTAILLLLLSRAMPALHPPGLVVLGFVVALTLVSGADYFLRFWRDVLRGPSRSAGTGTEPPATSADTPPRKADEGLTDRPGPREPSMAAGVSAARRGPRP
jgi:CDP-diacylglycerol--glycerol-3-phosphate 3-phosphatidyltransferase